MPVQTGSLTRRSMLSVSLQAAALGVAGSSFPVRAATGGPADRAVVCIYLFGGNDGNNVIVPLNRYNQYARRRGALALPRQSLLSVTGVVSGNEYGFHPAMTEVANLFRSRSVAVVANVGRIGGTPINNSATRAEFNSMRSVDPSLQYLTGGYVMPGWARGLASRADAVTGFPGIHGASGVSLVSTDVRGGVHSDIVERGIAESRQLRASFPSTGIGQQLKTVAGTIAAGSGTQVFLAQLGGFATSVNQLEKQGALLGELSDAMGAFYRATVELGIANRVVTYTDSEYSRTLSPNEQDGSDRGWGGHQIVMGGSVVGGELYGEIPEMEPGGPRDVTGTGVWLPSVSKDRYSAAFAEWLGMPSTGTAGPGLRFLA